MVHTTITNIVGPTISSNDPLGQLRHHINHLLQQLQFLVVLLLCSQQTHTVIITGLTLVSITRILQPGLESSTQLLALRNAIILQNTLYTCSQITTLD